MKIYLLITLLGTWFVQQSIQTDPEIIKVSIYYESLCPASIDFITKQLYPTYQEMKSSLWLDFIPYGNANQERIDGKWKFECQHEEPECWGNKAQVCGLAENKGQEENMEFVNCVMSHGTSKAATEEAIEKCAPKLGVTAKSLIDCANGERGDELHALLGIRTHKIGIESLPTVVFNDHYDPKIQDSAENEFLETVCNIFVKKPSACP